MSYIVKLTQNTTVLELKYVKAVPLSERTHLVEQEIPGSLGGKLQFMGSPPQKLRLEGFLLGANALNDLETLRSFQSSGKTVDVEVLGHGGEVWASGAFSISSLEYDLQPGLPSASEAAKVNLKIELVKA